MPIIEIDHLTKQYQLGRNLTIKRTMIDLVDRLRGRQVPHPAPFEALRDVNFSIERGEVVGIIGHNGAGKSTLLKMLSRISSPTSGSVHIHGSVAPLIEVGAGLVGDMTGRENVFLNGAIMGVPKAIIQQKFDEIVQFAELEKFIDTPIKRYSSGMQIRLAFAVATSVDPDILIVDEVLAVGDLAFQRKCFDRMERLIKDQGKTVLLVSHNIRQVERLCTRVILMDRGQVVADGDPTDVCNLFFERQNDKIKENVGQQQGRNQQVTDDLRLEHVVVLDDMSEPTDKVTFRGRCRVRVTFTAMQELKRICFLVGIHTTDFFYLTANNTVENPIDYAPGTHTVEMTLESMVLLPGIYSLRVWIGTPEGRVSFYAENLCPIQIVSEDFLIARQQQMGVVHMDATWDMTPLPIESDAATARPFERPEPIQG